MTMSKMYKPISTFKNNILCYIFLLWNTHKRTQNWDVRNTLVYLNLIIRINSYKLVINYSYLCSIIFIALKIMHGKCIYDNKWGGYSFIRCGRVTNELLRILVLVDIRVDAIKFQWLFTITVVQVFLIHSMYI